MRLCRFDEGRLGVVEGQTIRDVTAALDVLPAQRYPFPRHDLLVEHLDLVVERARSLAPGAPSRSVDSVRPARPTSSASTPPGSS
jgi:hypothetical protein